MKWAQRKEAFTIVELLIVIVVIVILAAITIVAYNGIRDRANVASATSAAAQVYKKVESAKVTDGVYPASLAAIGVSDSASTTYDYRTFGYGQCVSATVGNQIYHTSTDTPNSAYGSCGQVRAEYFNNGALTPPSIRTQYEDQINFSWGAASPVPGVVNADNFSIRYNSYLIPPVTGVYTFYTLVDDGERVTVDGTLLGDFWTGPCCSTKTMPTTISLTAGVAVPLIVEMREGGGGASMRLLWSYPGQAQITIPSSAYTRVP